MKHLKIDSLPIDNGTVLAAMEVSPKRFHLKRRQNHGKENLEESEEAGSNEAPGDCWPEGINKRFCSTRATVCSQARTDNNYYGLKGLPPKGWQPFLLGQVSLSEFVLPCCTSVFLRRRSSLGNVHRILEFLLCAARR
jgi:hypothetical protein